jgi:hypothetical protein
MVKLTERQKAHGYREPDYPYMFVRERDNVGHSNSRTLFARLWTRRNPAGNLLAQLFADLLECAR